MYWLMRASHCCPHPCPCRSGKGNDITQLCQQLQTEANFLPPSLQELRQWRNIAFCLSQLSMGDRGLRRMADLLRCYKAALHDGEVLACLQVGQPGIGAVQRSKAHGGARRATLVCLPAVSSPAIPKLLTLPWTGLCTVG